MKLINLLLVLTLSIPLVVEAEIFIFEISNAFETSKNPLGAPWATVTFQDTVSDHVQMSITLPKESSLSLTQINFNFDPKQSSLLSSLNIENISGIVPNGIEAPKENSFSAGSARGFDFQIVFDSSGKDSAQRLTGGTSSYFEITGKGVTASMFNFGNPSGSGPFMVAVQMQGSGRGESNFWAANGDAEVPEPSTYVLLAGMLVVIRLRRPFKSPQRNPTITSRN